MKQQIKRKEFENLTKKLLAGKQLGKLDEEKWENQWRSAKEEAEKVLEQGKIDNYERFGLIRGILAFHAYETESYELFQRLQELDRKSVKEEAKRILEQGNFDNYKKKDWERVNLVCYQLSHDPSDDATEVRKQLREKWLRELKNKQAKK